MGGQVLHMGRRVVAKTVPPGQVDADVRAAHLAVDFFVTAEDGHIAKLRPLIHAFKREVRRDDLAAAIQRIFDNVAADISGGAGNQNRFHGSFLLRFFGRLAHSSYRRCSRRLYSSSAPVCFLWCLASCQRSSGGAG